MLPNIAVWIASWVMILTWVSRRSIHYHGIPPSVSDWQTQWTALMTSQASRSATPSPHAAETPMLCPTSSNMVTKVWRQKLASVSAAPWKRYSTRRTHRQQPYSSSVEACFYRFYSSIKSTDITNKKNLSCCLSVKAHFCRQYNSGKNSDITTGWGKLLLACVR